MVWASIFSASTSAMNGLRKLERFAVRTLYSLHQHRKSVCMPSCVGNSANMFRLLTVWTAQRSCLRCLTVHSALLHSKTSRTDSHSCSWQCYVHFMSQMHRPSTDCYSTWPVCSHLYQQAPPVLDCHSVHFCTKGSASESQEGAGRLSNNATDEKELKIKPTGAGNPLVSNSVDCNFLYASYNAEFSVL
jgi:hypothetical protein